jgi:hypothetical protein
MYLLDPERGRRRRALARDKFTSALASGEATFAAKARDLSNRARGVIAEMRSSTAGVTDAPDPVLVERVRAKLGQHVSHPGSVEVVVANGRVILAGPVLASEVERLVRAVHRVRGVRDVESHLQVLQEAGNQPGLQRGVARGRERLGPMGTMSSPMARAVVGAAAAGLVLLARRRRRLPAAVLRLLGRSL